MVSRGQQCGELVGAAEQPRREGAVERAWLGVGLGVGVGVRVGLGIG